MYETVLELLLAGVAGYVLIGGAFALFFVAYALPRADAGARQASIGLRLLLLPGATVFWPLLLARWLRSRRMPDETFRA